LSLGAIDYITKPFVPPLLLKRIEVHLLVEAQRRELQNFNDNLQELVEEKTQKVLELYDTAGRYLSDGILKHILKSPDAVALGGKKRFITILMSDIRGFTLLSENMRVEDVVTVLNNYYGIMVDVIHKYDGTIIEFIGDAILAVFGAPFDNEKHADNAVACAIEMQMAMGKVNNWNIEHDFPTIEMGIGVNTGETIVGNIGSRRIMKYNVIGSHVNLTSRIESFTTGGQVLISEYTFKHVKAQLSTARVINVHPKGIPTSISVYHIDGIAAPFNLSIKETTDELHALQTLLKCAVIRYTINKWKQTGSVVLLKQYPQKRLS
jgi:class 3 adenylate cyclase